MIMCVCVCTFMVIVIMKISSCMIFFVDILQRVCDTDYTVCTGQTAHQGGSSNLQIKTGIPHASHPINFIK